MREEGGGARIWRTRRPELAEPHAPMASRLSKSASGRIAPGDDGESTMRKSVREKIGLGIERIGEVIAGTPKDNSPIEPVATPWMIQESHGAWALSDDGGTLFHERKGHDLGLPGIVLKTGVTKLSFKVIASHNNKGHNIFIGVMDADAERKPPVAADLPHTDRAGPAGTRAPAPLGAGKAGAAWGYHPYDGMIYYTPDAYLRGVKGASQKEGEVMRELPHMRGDAEGQTLHVVVDMNQKKLLMGVNDDMEPVDVGITLPTSVQPYVFFDWRDDAVELLGNSVQIVERQPSRRHVPSKQTARAVRTARGNTKPKGGGLLTDRGAAPKPTAQVTNRRTFNPEQHLELAMSALMQVHKSDSLALNNAISGFSLGESPSRALMLKELERCAVELEKTDLATLQA